MIAFAVSAAAQRTAAMATFQAPGRFSPDLCFPARWTSRAGIVVDDRVDEPLPREIHEEQPHAARLLQTAVVLSRSLLAGQDVVRQEVDSRGDYLASLGAVTIPVAVRVMSSVFLALFPFPVSLGASGPYPWTRLLRREEMGN